MLLSIITPCCRPNNLPLLFNSIIRAKGDLPIKVVWYISFDSSKIAPGYDFTFETSSTEIEIHYEYVFHEKSKAGNAQRNFALDAIDEGYICFLDDDNIVHSSYIQMIYDVFLRHGYDKIIICNQLNDKHQLRNLGIRYCSPGKIDAAQFIIPRKYIGNRRWYLPKYEADGLFIEDIVRQYGREVYFVDKPNCYYNAIATQKLLYINCGEKMLRRGDVVRVDLEYLKYLQSLPANRELRRCIALLGKLTDTELEIAWITQDLNSCCINIAPLDYAHPKHNNGNGINIPFPDPEQLHKAFTRSTLFGDEFGFKRKICFGPQWESATHRSGWKYAVSALRCLHSRNEALLDGFIENTFSWNRDISLVSGIIPYNRPWVGFIHNPPNMPEWFGDGHSSNAHIFALPEWKKSLEKCRGLYTLSEYHKRYLKAIYPDLPINHLYHPTETPDVKFNLKTFMGNPERLIIQVGWWLRKPFSLHQLKVTNYTKCILGTGNPWQHLMKTHVQVPEADLRSVNHIGFQKNSDYDNLLSQNIVFVDLHDSSANNAVIECIVRNTPILVNRLEPVVEYLGEDYPFYFESLEEASAKANNLDCVASAHKYLASMPKEKFTKEFFLKSFVASEIYQSL